MVELRYVALSPFRNHVFMNFPSRTIQLNINLSVPPYLLGFIYYIVQSVPKSAEALALGS